MKTPTRDSNDHTHTHAHSHEHGHDHDHHNEHDHHHDHAHEHEHDQKKKDDNAGTRCSEHALVHSHAHGKVEDTSGSRLLITLALNLIIPVVQVAGGLMAGSVALISDAAHNFSDFTAVLIAYFAYLIGRKGASLANTFGYRRAEVLAALLNVMILVGASIFIIHEAFGRFLDPQPVIGALVIWIAGVGVLGNGFSAWLLHRDAAHSLNVRGAFLHMLGDLFTSVVVVINGIVLLYRPWYWLDPALSILIVAFILKNCYTILREAAPILMNATPKGLDPRHVQVYIESFSGVRSVHHIHAWNVSAISIAFSAHVVVDDQLLSQTETLGRRIRAELLKRYNIDHAVLQFETSFCGTGDILCELNCGAAAQ